MLNEALVEQINLENEIDKIDDPTRLKIKQTKIKKVTYENINKLLKVRQKVLIGLKDKIFAMRKPTQVTALKILTPREMLQGLLPIAHAQVKAIPLKT